MSQRILMIILILVIVIGGGFYAYKQLLPPEVEEATGPIYSTKEVVRGDISVGVETSGGLNSSRNGGIMVPGNRYERGTVSYIIKEFLVEQGDMVEKDQPLAILDSSKLEDDIKQKTELLETKVKTLSDMTGVSESNVEFINPYQGIDIKAPISGRVIDLNVTEGEELEQNIIARIVDDSRFKVKAKFTVNEFQKVKVGQKVSLAFSTFDGFYEGVITEINPNPIPNNGEDGFAKGFVHMGEIEGKNPGLVQKGMKVNVGIKDEVSGAVNFLGIPGEVEGFVKEEKVVNTFTSSESKPIVTRVNIKNMQLVKEGDTIITLAGEDIKEDIEKYVNEIRDLKTEINELKNQLEQLEIKSPMDGIVAEFHRQVGDSVGPGDWIGYIFNVSDMRMWCPVDDIDILNVRQGASVRVTVDALPGQNFEGVVSNVSPHGETVNGVTKYMVDIEVSGSPELKPGMQAKAFIDGGSAEDVLLVPLEAIFEEDGKTMVEILDENGNPKVIPIKIGLMNDRVAEVKEGLEEGDKVITGSSADILPSQHLGSKDSILPTDNEENNEENENQSN